jgi:hypothetical protein
METTWTSHAEPEVSEAMAVNIYPHQSKSVVLVDHSAKPSESSFLEQNKPSELQNFTVKLIGANGGAPVTPPQQFSVDDVDSPLRNPRAPPKPPVINFIPATPSGLTPSFEKEKQLGNYYEMTEEKPKRSLSLLRRTFSRGRQTEYGPSPSRPVGLLKRTFSLSRNVKRHRDDWDDDRDRRPRLKRRSTVDDMPDESRLHPFWRPAYAEDESSEEEDEGYDDEEEEPEDRTYRYPPIDNRPPMPRRSLSARLKRTFAIMPVQDDHYDHYPATGNDTPDRRTIRRTPSGNLRVMKFRRSMESLRGMPLENGRPYTAPEQGGRNVGRYARLWRTLSSAKPKLPRANYGPSSSAAAAAATAAESGKSSGSGDGGGFLPALSDRMNITRRLSERRREKRTQELRGMISGPKEVRDGVGDVIRRGSQGCGYVLQQQPQHRWEV